ncbi:phage baseplate assembly protein V [Cetobacterium sp.]|uniref:phage baseplate assembly protein V n=1 Tax=Cetobacterium sp. TaxID=2071632 RepID=UPI003F2EAD76
MRIIAIARIEFGEITTINAVKSTAKVKLPELDGKTTGDLLVLVPLANGDKDFKVFLPGTMVVCLFMENTLERGFILGTFFSEKFKTPDGATKDKRILEYPGGAKIEIDKSTGVLNLDIVKTLNVNVPIVNVNSDEINFNSKDIKLKGKVTANSIEVKENLDVGGDTTTQGTTKTDGGRVL